LGTDLSSVANHPLMVEGRGQETVTWNLKDSRLVFGSMLRVLRVWKRFLFVNIIAEFEIFQWDFFVLKQWNGI
jgi:hypothetical protein